jgi:hypothetical protein
MCGFVMYGYVYVWDCNCVGGCMCGNCTCVAILVMHNTYHLDYPDGGFSCFFFSCKANARVILAKTGHGPHPSKLVFVLTLIILLFYGYFILFYLYFILFYVISYYSMYYFYIILCIVCVYMCTNHCHRVFIQLQLTNISI